MIMKTDSTGFEEKEGSYLQQRGAARKFLDNKGFGWLMEVAEDNEEQDEDMKKPLL